MLYKQGMNGESKSEHSVARTLADGQGTSGRGSHPVGAALLMCALVCGGLWAGVEALRSPTVLKRAIAPRLATVAAQQGVDLSIGAMGPAGWTGVRAYEVRVGKTQGGQRAEARFDEVELHLDWSETLRARAPKLGEVRLGRFELWGGEASAEAPDVREGADEVSAGRASNEGSSERTSLQAAGRTERFLAPVVRVSWEGGPVDLQGALWPVELGAGEARVDVTGRTLVSMSARGELDSQPFEAGLEGEALVVRTEAMDVAALLRAPAGQLEVESVSLELGASLARLKTGKMPERVTLTKMRARPSERADVALEADTSTLERRGPTVIWRSEGARVRGAQTIYALRDVELSYRADVPGIGLVAEVLDDEGGHLNVEAQWHLPSAMVGINAWFHDFAWDGTTPWPVPGSSRVERALLEGTLHGEVDLAQRIADLNGDLVLEEFHVSAPFLAEETLKFKAMEVGLGATFDAGARALSVGAGRLKLGELDEVRWSGHVIDAGRGFSFGWSLAGDDLDASQVLSELPEAMSGMLAKTRMKGRFGVDLATSGHSAFPDSLMLDVSFTGDVQVEDSLRWDAMRAAGVEVPEEAGGGGFFDSRAHPARDVDPKEWVRIARLPAHVPSALLSAEDATFLQHAGLDWVGLRMAMVHNLREGALERGGSTITQQLAKNLFLTRDRTISRKLQEAFLTWRMESELSKEQILELYTNVVDWGPGVHGLYQASRFYFDRNPDELSVSQSAMLGAILPAPSRFGALIKAGYLPSSRQDKMRRVLVNMRFLEQLTWPEYHAALDEVNRGNLGGVQLAVCADDETAGEDDRSCVEVLESQVEEEGDGEMSFEDGEGSHIPTETGWMPLTH
ncbi:hypothetical protein EA187_16490 [Lujinxingia sediminis]|uniref:Glycosyl transferase family 51 domain-containing protein n=1 Tax=Lujinxingia sediminis TaxID=2480984 RepID=A0ABY0CQV8_9DELT|nr:transglycosylase domain-containing protein [Lujinxingia sediminis]RVU42475.1 hypothetical protein EA187_16490 [Lujinxingia sediminis]